MGDDRTAKARLRDAAIGIVASGGAEELTARAVAERAGLSAGLIRHHFGSMSDLLVACDEHVAAAIRRLKQEAIDSGLSFDALSAVRRSGESHLMGYLAARVADDSDRINELVDTLVDDAAVYMAEGTGRGLFAPTEDQRRRAAMLTLFSLGSLALHHHLKRLLGVDIRAADLASQPGFADYLRVQMEVFTGVVTPEAAALYGSALDHLREEP